MKKILKRGLYIMKAKGRHGTHSPFVYAFVEQVLRSKTKFIVQEKNTFSQKEISLLGRAFQYLNPSVVYVEDDLKLLIEDLKSNNAPLHFEVKPMNLNEHNHWDNGLYFCLPTKENIAFLKSKASSQTITAIILHQHKSKTNFENWEELGRDENLKMVMDVWSFGFVSNNADFKLKQFFRLR